MMSAPSATIRLAWSDIEDAHEVGLAIAGDMAVLETEGEGGDGHYGSAPTRLSIGNGRLSSRFAWQRSNEINLILGSR